VPAATKSVYSVIKSDMKTSSSSMIKFDRTHHFRNKNKTALRVVHMIRRAQPTSILATKLGSISYIFVGITSGMATTAIDSDLFTDIYGNVKIKKNNSILTIITPL
jgi:hypothetical protein